MEHYVPIKLLKQAYLCWFGGMLTMCFWVLRANRIVAARSIFQQIHFLLLYCMLWILWVYIFNIINGFLNVWEKTFKILPEEFGGIAFVFLYSKTSYLISAFCLFWVVLFSLPIAKYKPEFHSLYTYLMLTMSVPVPYVKRHVFKLGKYDYLLIPLWEPKLAFLILVYRVESACL